MTDPELVSPCTGAFLFEDVGVTAFHGAIPQMVNKSNLETLAGISPVEAYHAAILRTLLYQKGSEMVTPYNIRVYDFVQVCTLVSAHPTQSCRHIADHLHCLTGFLYHPLQHEQHASTHLMHR